MHLMMKQIHLSGLAAPSNVITARGLKFELTENAGSSHFKVKCSGKGNSNEWESNAGQWIGGARGRDNYLKQGVPEGATQYVDWGAVKGTPGSRAVTITCRNKSNGWAETTGTIKEGSSGF